MSNSNSPDNQGWETASRKKKGNKRDNQRGKSEYSTKKWTNTGSQSKSPYGNQNGNHKGNQNGNHNGNRKKTIKVFVWELVCETEKLSIADCEEFIARFVDKKHSESDIWQLILYRIVNIGQAKYKNILIDLFNKVNRERTLDMSNFNLINALLWSGTDDTIYTDETHEYFVFVLSMLYRQFSTNLFLKNSKDESLIDSLREKKKASKDSISDDEYYFRYGCIFSNVTNEQLCQMTKQLFNKLNDKNLSLFTSRYRYLLSQDYELVINATVALITSLRQEKLTKDPSKMLQRYVRMINFAISGANDRYRSKTCNDPDLTMYFQENMFGIEMVTENDMYQQFADSICTIGFTADIANWKQETYELASALLGELAKTNNGFVDTFKDMLAVCSSDTEIKYIKMDTSVNMCRVVLRGLLQYQEYNDMIHHMLGQFKDSVQGSDKFLLKDIQETLAKKQQPQNCWSNI